jgi:hypothetical protein
MAARMAASSTNGLGRPDGGKSDQTGMEMRTKKGFMTAALATAMVAGVPAVAQAHHVAGGSAQCSLVNNVPTITASATFQSFASNNKPIAGQLTVDGTSVETISGFTFAGSNGT